VKKRIALAVTAGSLAGLSAAFGHVDWYPQIDTYGISVGTDTHYCSVELVSWRPEAGCQAGR
jgi:hypothetical protein